MHEALLKLGFSDAAARTSCTDALDRACTWATSSSRSRWARARTSSTPELRRGARGDAAGRARRCSATRSRSRRWAAASIEVYKQAARAEAGDGARNSLIMHIYSLVFDWCVDVINDYIAAVQLPTSASACSTSSASRTLRSTPSRSSASTSPTSRCTTSSSSTSSSSSRRSTSREEVEWNFVEYEDNQHVIDLIAKRPVCILGLLDEGCANRLGHRRVGAREHARRPSRTAKYKAYIKPKKSRRPHVRACRTTRAR